MKRYKAYIFDLDGTIYFGDEPAEGARELLSSIAEGGGEIYYMTNNSRKTRKQISGKLQSMGIPAVPEQVYASGTVAVDFLAKNGYRNVYALGAEEIREELIAAGVPVTDREDLAETLLIGLDFKVDYEMLTKAVRAAMRVRCFIACNLDRTFPGQDKELFPGCAAIVAAVEACSGRKADFIIGKPSTMMLEELVSEHGLAAEEILVVGDNYDTDIAMAEAYGCDSVLVHGGEYVGIPCFRTLRELQEYLERD